jgi:pimeloyl-ACP methyl ester carboxylesterase
VEAPEVRYAKSGDVNIAYGVVGDGPIDLVFIAGHVFSTLELAWQGPSAEFFEGLASFSRLILLDKRGTGLSDRVIDRFDLETRMDDVRAVMDAAGSERAALMGISEGGPMTLVFGATYPERTVGAILYGSSPFGRLSEWTREGLWEKNAREAETRWTEADYLLDFLGRIAPSIVDDEAVRRWWVRHMRQSASPAAVGALLRMNATVDVVDILPLVRVPTLVVHRIDDGRFSIDVARVMARSIPNAQLVELPGRDHAFFVDPDPAVAEVRRFLRSLSPDEWREPESERILATVVFTDIVGSTLRAAELGDRRWRELLSEHNAILRSQLARYRGREIDTAGDGFFATFDGPARAIRCARAIVAALRAIGLDVRVGVHTGECEVVDGKVGGIAVHIGARVASEAAAGEVLVSSTVKDLVAGSGLEFADRGFQELKGIGEWRLFAVES